MFRTATSPGFAGLNQSASKSNGPLCGCIAARIGNRVYRKISLRCWATNLGRDRKGTVASIRMQFIENEEQLEDRLSTPSEKDVAMIERLGGDIILLGAGGKMGPSLAHRVKRAIDASGNTRRVIAVSRFATQNERERLDAAGIETISCDLLDRDAVANLPECENVLFLAGRKFGSKDRIDLTWAMNTVVPANVASRFRSSRIVVFSTGNVYPFVSAQTGGSVERDATDPRGEYAQSCLGRERVFEYFSCEFGTRALLFRLNYAVDLRYGTLVDIASKVYESRPVDITVSQFNTIWQGDANSY